MNNRLQYLLNLLESQPGESFVLFAVAKEYEKGNDDAKALEFYRKLRAADPAYVGLYYHLGKLYERLGDTEQAREAYEAGSATARQAGDRHALGELQAALLDL